VAEIGDHAWKELLGQHHFMVRQQIERHGGREIDTTGDGFLATFDGPVKWPSATGVPVSSSSLGPLRGPSLSAAIRPRSGEKIHLSDCPRLPIHLCLRVAALRRLLGPPPLALRPFSISGCAIAARGQGVFMP
jgi:class 3 adenylate cyclase